jgi:hypothetical protein
MIKNAILICLVLATTSSLSQITYLGLKEEGNIRFAQIELADSGAYWPKSKIIGDSLYVCTSSGIYVKNINTQVNDTLWSTFAFPNIPIRDFIKNDNTILALASKKTDSLMLLSTDNGQSYINHTSPFFFNHESVNTIRAIDQHPTDNNSLVVLHSGYGVAKSTDFGNSWQALQEINGGYQDLFVAYHPLDPNSIYYCGEFAFFDSYIYASFDGGSNWILTGNYPNHATHCLNFDPTNQNVILSGNEGFLRKSYDKGVTWEPKTILPIYIYSIERDPDNPNHIYATGDLNGIDETIWVFRSVDNGETWSIFFEEDFPNADGAMDLQIKNGKIFLHTLTSGNFMIDIQALSVEENDYDANDFKLYPNPVNDSFSILSKNSIDKVQIYNAQGNLLLKKHLNQSSYTFDDLGLSSGIYFIRASTGNNTIYKKFIVR